MNFYIDAGGNILTVEPERVYQGSARANVIRLIAPFAFGSAVTVSYILPDGTQTQPQLMTPVAELSGVQTSAGVLFSTWQQDIGVKFVDDNGTVKPMPDYTILENAGVIGVVFTISQADSNGNPITVSTARSSFVCEKGTPLSMPAQAFDDYESLLNQILAQLSVAISNNASNVSRIDDLEAWKVTAQEQIDSNSQYVEDLELWYENAKTDIDNLEDWQTEADHHITVTMQRVEEQEVKINAATKGVAFTNYEEMVAAVNNLSGDAANGGYNVGQSIYIRTVNVPDLWVFGKGTFTAYTYTTDEAFIEELTTNGTVQVGYYVLAQLETNNVEVEVEGTTVLVNGVAQTPTWNADTKADVYYVDDKFNGATKGVSFTNYQALVATVNNLSPHVPIDGYNIGQSIYIETLNVPDLWVSGVDIDAFSEYTYTTDENFVNTLQTQGYIQIGYYRLAQLETGKVDLDYTKVTVGGVVQSTWDADTKVDKVTNVTSEQQAYIKNRDGSQAVLNILPTPTSGSSGIPNKSYVDNYYVAKPTDTSDYNRVIGVDTSNAPLTLNMQYPSYTFDETGAALRNGIPTYVSGQLGCSTPTSDYSAANKKYVDNNIYRRARISFSATSTYNEETIDFDLTINTVMTSAEASAILDEQDLATFLQTTGELDAHGGSDAWARYVGGIIRSDANGIYFDPLNYDAGADHEYPLTIPGTITVTLT